MKTHIFDMDGLLIDSEPFWRSAEIKIFSKLGIPFTEEMCRETVGIRIDEVVVYWNEKLSMNMPVAETSEAIQLELIDMVLESGKPLNGVLETLDLLKQQNRICALASSSSMRIIEAVVNKLEIKDYFKILHSAEFEKQGKPHPDVFLTTATKLNVKPEDCIVYEDSKNGMLAGLRAGMKVVIIPELPDPHQEWHSQANLKWSSMIEFNLQKVESL